MARKRYLDLGRRERQIMDAIYRLDRPSVSEVLEDLPDPPSYSAVRTMLGKLEAKGLVGHEEDGPRFRYFALQSPTEATRSTLRRVLKTFFDGSATKAVAAVLDLSKGSLTADELEELTQMIEEAKKRGR